jgi:hypothetical protein
MTTAGRVHLLLCEERGEDEGMNAHLLRKKLIVIGGAIMLVTAVAAGSQSSAPSSAPPQRPLNWRPWSDAAFAEAKRNHRFVFT